MVRIHIKLFTTCTSTCKYSKDMQCGSKKYEVIMKATFESQGQDCKDFVVIFLCDMDYYPWFLIVLSIEDRVSSQDCQDLVSSSTVVTGRKGWWRCQIFNMSVSQEVRLF